MEVEISNAKLKELVKKKDSIEDEIKALNDVLISHGSAAVNEPLVDSEGYPRNDIDVHQVRIVRNKLACLQNDHKAIMSEIEKGLYSLHASIKEKKNDNSIVEVEIDVVDESGAFAMVNFVSKDSPADIAKLKVGDKILQFGSITKSNFNSMQTIANIVKHSEGKTIEVYIIKNNIKARLSLTPKKWHGKGLLGCNIVPL